MTANRVRPTFGYITPYIWGELSLSYFKGAIRGAINHDANLICVIGQTPNDRENNNDSANIAYDLVDKRLRDGLVIWASHFGQFLSKDQLEQFYKKFQGIPIVAITGEVTGAPSVLMDNRSGIIALVEHFVKVHGCAKIGFVRGPVYHLSSEERYAAYLEGMSKVGLQIDDNLISEPMSIEKFNGRLAVTNFIEQRKLKPGVDFEALICVSDQVGLGVVEEIQARGYSVPGDVLVAGFNNKNESKMSNPALTTVDPQLFTFGQIAIDMLVKQSLGQSVPEQFYVENRLVLRQSCGCAHLHNPSNDKISENSGTRLFSNEDITYIVEQLKTMSYQNYL